MPLKQHVLSARSTSSGIRGSHRLCVERRRRVLSTHRKYFLENDQDASQVAIDWRCDAKKDDEDCDEDELSQPVNTKEYNATHGLFTGRLDQKS